MSIVDSSPVPDASIRHINILTQDLDASWTFYRDVLGFVYICNLGPDKIAAEFRGFDFYIEAAVNWKGPDQRIHFGLRTDRKGVHDWLHYPITHGIPLVKGNNPAPEMYEEPGSNRVALYFQDPDGWTIEVYSPE